MRGYFCNFLYFNDSREGSILFQKQDKPKEVGKQGCHADLAQEAGGESSRSFGQPQSQPVQVGHLVNSS